MNARRALSVVRSVRTFRAFRTSEFAAWLGLVQPRDHATEEAGWQREDRRANAAAAAVLLVVAVPVVLVVRAWLGL
ncbi:hypothetical protein [Verrucosispora sp. WMMC514]|uniref:hypothetical protein n=1 Tax=Verrucosispora sp. WMMC514 TaxID=3015156 RepID=UPI00248B7BA8|nr:hypothetical protein [Verrucosispora sp. WMMC514]WBB94263.1 hypothetical protein O7597_15540 [Verrucosispora sp. WMMC514]